MFLILFYKLKDVVKYIVIALSVVLGVGIYYHANLWPDHKTMWSGGLTRWRIWTIIFYPYWQIYGEANLETLTGTDFFSDIFLFQSSYDDFQPGFKGKQNSEQRQCRSIRYTKQFHRELCFVKIIGFLFAKIFSYFRTCLKTKLCISDSYTMC